MSSKENFKLLNSKLEPLTLQKFRELSGSDLPDEEAEEVIESIRRFARVLFKLMIAQRKQVSSEEDLRSNYKSQNSTVTESISVSPKPFKKQNLNVQFTTDSSFARKSTI